MNRFPLLLALALAVLIGSIATRAQFETPNRAFHSNTTFPLTGRHQVVACESCHLKGVFKGTPRTCYDCHWVRRQDDKFKTTLGTQCESCHRTISWTAVRWDHAALTGMPLNGAHRTIGCESCHTNGRFTGVAVSCVNCHQKDYAATTTPNHAAAGFPTACEACHRPADVAFSQARFDHNASFPLTGPHQTTTCASCHRNNVFRGTSRECSSCHQADFARAQEPNHVAAGFPTTCELCHRANAPSWRTSGTTAFAHASFPLVGLHAQQTCTSCHRNSVFAGTPRDCVGCHRPAYERTTTPNHIAAGFPTTCESCHRPSEPGWRSSGGFNHAQFFPLVGQHTMQTCVACHTNNQFKGTARDCVGCHRANYERTTTPNHAQAGFPTTCENCHRPTDPSWGGGNFNHNQVFALAGRHATAACAACHVNNVFRGTARDCVGCHRTEYDRTTAPNHVQAGFPTTCDNCHRNSDQTWRNANFNHNQVFQLVGKHATVACAVCHVNNVFRGTARECIGCHRAEYDRTATPNHAAAGFSTNCETCHRPTDQTWRGVTFNHNTFFALQGIHALQACATCHRNNVYRGTPRDCVSCHRAKYDATRNPNHVQSGFPTTCENCHRAGDTNWNQGRFSHTRFPLSGRHNVACVQCHTTNNPPVFNCLVCHTRSETDSHHRNRAGYRYESAACYSCHANGRAD
ncbi:MAG: hypothetical protein KA371_18285 [Acidobacteria bacterium]|nr:hypothetical protein [Acidobacteriota bacterium]